MIKNDKGITLIALVITIIVLLILAGVTINLTLGEGGIFKLAEDAGKKYSFAEALDKVNLKIVEANAACYSKNNRACTLNELKDYIQNDKETEIIVKSYNKIATTTSVLSQAAPQNLNNIVVGLVDNDTFQFLINKECKIEKVSMDGGRTFQELNGNGTTQKEELKKIEIYNEEDLINIKNDLTANYIIMNDIPLSKPWTPIGTFGNGFIGTLDGNYHKITGLQVSSSGEYQGLFGYIGAKRSKCKSK